MMKVEVTAPIKLMIAILLGVGVMILIMIQFAAGIGNASVSTQIISTNTNLTNLLPWIGAMLAGGLFMVAIEGKRRH